MKQHCHHWRRLGGMAAAFDLRRAGHSVTIFEAADYCRRSGRRFQRAALGLVGGALLPPLVHQSTNPSSADRRAWAFEPRSSSRAPRRSPITTGTSTPSTAPPRPSPSPASASLRHGPLRPRHRLPALPGELAGVGKIHSPHEWMRKWYGDSVCTRPCSSRFWWASLAGTTMKSTWPGCGRG